ncbi:MAG: diguanylate cyclase/phosphodiesterase with PAS/PAC sensor(s) [uncultured bacterium]|nr:MAG: diguanylate cyclase/phosphodiesterase with PAS/PAC sensor(s) [uncultured bacterium]
MEFVLLAEETGLIIGIGDWVFKESARWARRWRDQFAHDFQVSVNVSPVQFLSEYLCCNTWGAHLRGIGLAGQNIVIEITEGLLLKAATSVTDKLLKFRDAGIQVAIDDFGTGYSSLSYLKKFDIDYLKIDKLFVDNLETDVNDMVLCEAIIVMAHKLGLKVIAEGVETEAQRNLLTNAGCDYAQGYLFSRPVSPEALEALLKAAT